MPDVHTIFVGIAAAVFAVATFDVGIAFLIRAVSVSTPDD